MAANVNTSSSRIIEGTHNFKIHKFSYLKGMGVGEYITSDTFSVAGHLWEINFYPDGECEHKSGNIYVSVFVSLASKPEKALMVWIEYYLLDQNGNRWGRFNNSSTFVKMEMNQRDMVGPITLNTVWMCWGLDDFYQRTELEKSQFIKDDCLTIQCSVHVAETSTDVPEIIVEPLSDLKQSYELLLESGQGSDISFEVDGKIFNAHKLILSTRSPVFKAQFFGPLKADGNNQCIKIEEITAPVFKDLLRFIYCDDTPYLDSLYVHMIRTQHLLVAADRYGIQTLKSLCEIRLCKNLLIDNVASILALADRHSCCQLKTRCLEFIRLPENIEAVMQTDGFKDLYESCPAVICELLKSSVDRERDLSCDPKEKRMKLR